MIMDLEHSLTRQATAMMRRKHPIRRTDQRSAASPQPGRKVYAGGASGRDLITRLRNYRLPAGKVAHIDYSLAGSHSEDPVYLTLYLDEVPVLAFPCCSPDDDSPLADSSIPKGD